MKPEVDKTAVTTLNEDLILHLCLVMVMKMESTQVGLHEVKKWKGKIH
jgi:hypothetical protein